MSQFTLVNHRGEKTKTFDSRAAATENRGDMIGLGADPEDFEIVQGAIESYEEYADGLDAVGNQPASEAKSDGGAEVVETADAEPVPTQEPTDELPDDGPSVSEDPLTWMPAEFTDTIDGTVAINRKGYEVMAHHYGIGTSSTCEVGPEETDFVFCRVTATATTDDGTTYEAHGSAHTARDDDAHLLLEMADTRARKRAIAQATGVGMVAVEELQNDL